MATFALLGDELITACGPDPSLACELVHGWTDSDIAARIAEWVVEKPLTVAAILFVAWILTLLARRAIDRAITRLVESRDSHEELNIASKALAKLPGRAAKLEKLKEASERANQRATTLGAVLKSIASGLIWIMAALIALGEIGISLGPLIAGAGIAGIAIGFGAQSLVRDFLAGIFIVIEDQYGVGDIVDVGEASGTIERVTLRTTRLRDVEGTLWVVPNGEIRRVGNKSQIWSRSILDIGVSYDTDLDRASDIIKAVADEVWLPRKRNDPRRTRDLGDTRVGGLCDLDTPGRKDRPRRTVGDSTASSRPNQEGVRRRGHRDPVPSNHSLAEDRELGQRTLWV